MDFLKQISDEISAITPEEFDEPDEDLYEGEEVIGVMSDELKRLFTWLNNHVRAMEKLICSGDASKKEFLSQDDRVDLAKQLFWAAVRNEFPQTSDGTGGGVRSGFRVVSLHKELDPEKLMMREVMYRIKELLNAANLMEERK